MITNYQKISQSSKMTLFRVLRQISYTKLFKKYSSGNFNYNKILANYLVFNDSCRIVARFKDYLILDDNTEFLRRFYYSEESHPRLNRILNFYETYSKIFPNYMILKESKYLYRNIRKKQKMIDAVNEIKREEEENRKKMKQNNDKNNNINNINELFTKKVKEEIKTFQENATFQRNNNNFDSDDDDFNENSISISLINKKMFENRELNFNTNKEIWNERNASVLESFVTNETNHSISGIINILNDNKIYIKDLPKILEINNYSKNSLKIKKINKIPKKEKRESEINEKNIKFQKSKNKQSKKYETFSRQYQLNKNILSNSSNLLNSINNNYIATKGELKKLSILSTSPGTVLASNTEKNINEINQYQNIIIPKGSTVININNNYFDPNPTSSILQMGYYSNKNFQINKNSKTNSNNLNYISSLKKSNTNNSNKNNLQLSEKKTNSKKFVKTLNNDNKFILQKKANYSHNKQTSQDFIYQKFNNNNEVKGIKEKLIKFNSLSPTPITSRFNEKYSQMKKNTHLSNEKDKNNNYLTENNPNLITGNFKTDENEDIERNRLLLYIREIIENKKNEIGESNNELKEKKIFSNEKEIINNNNKDGKIFSFNIFSKYKTISNFKLENNNYSNIIKDENRHLLEEKCFSKKDVLDQKEVISKEKNKSSSKNKNEENDKKNKYKKIQIKDKKNNKSKVIIKKNKTNSNYNTCHNTNSKNNSEKNKDFFKTNSNFKNHKNLFENMNKENSLMKSMEKQIKKHNKLLSLNNQALKLEQEEKNHLTEKGEMTLSQSIIFKGKKNSNSQMSKLLMSHKKEIQNNNENSNVSKKIYYKSKIKSLKYKKDNLNLENEIKSTDINSICCSNASNFYTEYNNTNQNMILTDIPSNNKSNKFDEVKKCNNSELRYKYKNFLLKKNKIKSCEFENQSAIQNKNNKELVDRMNILNQNKPNYFYQNFIQNQAIFGIKSYVNNINSFDNSNVTSKQAINSKGKNNNPCNGKNIFQTPSMENKKIGLYKKVINKKVNLHKTEKKEDEKRNKNFITPAAIKVNRSKFLENVKNKVYDNHSKTRIKK